MSWEALSALATAVQTAFVGFALIYAKRQVDEARSQGKAQSQQNAETLEAQSRPYVVVSLDIDYARPIAHILVQNCGQTVARDVSFDFTPELTSTLDNDGSRVAIRDLGCEQILELFGFVVAALAQGHLKAIAAWRQWCGVRVASLQGSCGCRLDG